MNRQNIFNRDVYPTPEHVLDMMELDIAGKKILDPHAGTGNILDYAFKLGADKIYYSEINESLAKSCENKGEQIGFDFLEIKEIPSVDLIIMNPPFTKWKDHIKHAWELAPEGCEIVSLCNSESLKITSFGRNEIGGLVENYGFSRELGKVFKDAERITDTPIALIKLYKPITTESINFDDYFDNVDDLDFVHSEGIVKYSEIDAIVNSYKALLRKADETFKQCAELKEIGDILGLELKPSVSIAFNENATSKDEFIRQSQKKMWSIVFEKLNVEKYLTSGVIKDLHKWIDEKSRTPFTKRNIFKMIEVIIGTKDQTFQRALVETVDEFTRYTHENRWNVEGWKTNAGHLLNQKFIISNMFEVSWNSDKILRFDHHRRLGELNDLIKVICNLTGKDFNKIEKFQYLQNIQRGKWYDSEFFEYKGFKKGTMHLKFKEKEVWAKVNKAYAEAKGAVLPEKI
ncbi:DUF4942 domain-containing protein [Flavobacteriaceae bacterium Ap0902]|nr:DUF4942 domain-containing protein [Flavobacteriaceae bacterium Ap0902]